MLGAVVLAIGAATLPLGSRARQNPLGEGNTFSLAVGFWPDSLRQELPIWQIGDSVHVLDMLRASNAGGLEASELEAWRTQHGLTSDSAQCEEDDQDDGPGVEHFALSGTDARLDSVIADLGKRGFSCRVVADPDVDGQVPVIKADPLSAPGFIDDQWDLVEEVVNAAAGEYDGWEASAGGK